MKYVVALLTIFCSAILWSAAPALAAITVSNPRVNGRPVDWCLFPARQCGRSAAAHYCQMRNMGTVVRFQGVRSGVPTHILGSGGICTTRQFSHCDRFSTIVCSASRFD